MDFAADFTLKERVAAGLVARVGFLRPVCAGLLYADQRQKVLDERTFNLEVQWAVKGQRWTQVDFQ